MYWIGLDEAGYGPTLGPLCHGVSVFHLPGHAEPPDLWVLFAKLVTRYPAPQGLLCVDDSKKVYNEKDGLSEVFRSVAQFLACSQQSTSSFNTEEELLAALLQGDDQGDVARDAWGVVAVPQPPVETISVPLQALLNAQKAECVFLSSAAYPARSFNEWLARNPNGNKADLNWARAQRMLKLGFDALEKHAKAHGTRTDPVFVSVDRQGGRKFYAAPLGQVFDGAYVTVLEEKNTRSAYRAEYRSRSVQTEFVVGGDSVAFPVALAALAAKFTREVLMTRFNAYFSKELPGTRPTAGYPTDAKRFLKETVAFRKKMKIADEQLVRQK